MRVARREASCSREKGGEAVGEAVTRREGMGGAVMLRRRGKYQRSSNAEKGIKVYLIYFSCNA